VAEDLYKHVRKQGEWAGSLSAFKTEQEFWSGEHYRKEETYIPFKFS
jgi:hypothetical protein